jgi:hypothetical protein
MLRIIPKFLEEAFGFLRVVGVHLIQVDGVHNPLGQYTHQRLAAAMEHHLGDLHAVESIATDCPPGAHIIKGFDAHVQ